MKTIIQSITAIKATASLAFTAQIMIFTVVSMIFSRQSIPIGYIWQMMFLSLIYGAVQLLAFSENYFKKMKTLGRISITGTTMFAVLALFAFTFKWFPIYSLINWLIFVGLYAVFFLVAVFALRTAFRLSGIKYNQMLAAYKAGNDMG